MTVGTQEPNRTIQGVYALGTTTVPTALDLLGAEEVDLTVVAVLRRVWCRGGTGFAVIDHTTLGRQLGIARKTAQNALSRAVKQGLLDQRRSKQKPKTLGHFCEYRISWKAVIERLGYDYDPDHQFSGEEGDWIANSPSPLPACWFRTAAFSGGKLEITVPGGATYILPENSDVVLKHVIESHFGRPILDGSLKTYMKVIEGRLTPRLLCLLANKLYHSETIPASAGYYTKVLQVLLPVSRQPPSIARSKKAKNNEKQSENEFIFIDYQDWVL